MSSRPNPETRCEWCGADHDPPAPPAAAPRAASPAGVADTQAEPATHCEWCGAPYPTPEGDAGLGINQA